MTSGALRSGCKIMWGLDSNPNAAQTWRANFPDAELFEKWADEFCSLHDAEGKLIVDILHLSPPCQVWSPAHTIPGKDDEMNFCSLFAVQELIHKAKPRIVTLEQTFGILHDRFEQPFNSLVRMFTDHGFSVSWQVIELQKYGVPQRRKRLIMVAAGSVHTSTSYSQLAC
jgi:DNA (cytosine-5)-methyltransferase 1